MLPSNLRRNSSVLSLLISSPSPLLLSVVCDWQNRVIINHASSWRESPRAHRVIAGLPFEILVLFVCYNATTSLIQTSVPD
jgi:hypothetical protein